jgi:hypothetical protein
MPTLFFAISSYCPTKASHLLPHLSVQEKHTNGRRHKKAGQRSQLPRPRITARSGKVTSSCRRGRASAACQLASRRFPRLTRRRALTLSNRSHAAAARSAGRPLDRALRRAWQGRLETDHLSMAESHQSRSQTHKKKNKRQSSYSERGHTSVLLNLGLTQLRRDSSAVLVSEPATLLQHRAPAPAVLHTEIT